jgi:hypothetical protein
MGRPGSADGDQAEIPDDRGNAGQVDHPPAPTGDSRKV